MAGQSWLILNFCLIRYIAFNDVVLVKCVMISALFTEGYCCIISNITI